DVDTIVNGLLTNDQSKLDKQGQLQQTLEWKQSAYQSITTELRTFQSSYLDILGSGSMLSSNTYSSYTGTSSSSVLSVSGNSAATAGKHTVDIYQSAVTSSVTGTAVSPSITGTADANTASLSGTSFFVTVDSVKKRISFGSDETFSQDSLNQKLKDAFGTDSSGACKVAAAVDSSGHVSFNSNGGYQSTITLNSASSSDALTQLGITDGTSNRLSQSSTLKSLFGDSITADDDGNFTVKINGNDVALNTYDSLTKTISTINAADAGVTLSYDSLSDKVTAQATTGGAAGEIDLDDNSTGFFTTLLGPESGRTPTPGQDAIVSIDGTKITRSSNNFTVSGVTYNINQKVAATSNPDDIQVTLTNNSSDAVSAIENFVNAYNKVITDINNAVQTKPDSSYTPLTDAKKAKMTTDEVTSWNTAAQKGILFNDSTLTGIVTEMRNMLDGSVTTTDGKKLSLNSIGITTGSYTENGQLHVNETALKSALANNPQEVMDLFTKSSSITYSQTGSAAQNTRHSEEGMAYRLQDIINNAASTGGSLITIAGMPNESSATTNSLYTQLKQVNATITSLTTQYKTDQTKYYNQFSSLEVYMEQMNEQSSYLTSMLSSSS
ncbi:MAG: flagellar filament capping protein FliD, partial [Clostridia bacterium]|nr:flagellar filament capping protein FliD [Clostridia bacterium]